VQVLQPQNNPSGLAPGARSINLNSKILPLYLNTILPGITDSGDDGHYGSSAMLDVLVLQVNPPYQHPARARDTGSGYFPEQCSPPVPVP
jgi:hypothetical protein